jgi:PAS domain S-box-containing protein
MTIPPIRLSLPGASSSARVPSGGHDALWEQASDIVLLVRPDGVIVDVNPAAVAAYGFDRDRLIGRAIADLRDPATLPAVPEQLAAAAASGVRFETSHRRADGTSFPVEVSSTPLERDGEPLLLSIIRDISQRKQAERRAEQLQAITAALLTALTPRDIVDIVARLAAPAVAASAGAIGLLTDDCAFELIAGFGDLSGLIAETQPGTADGERPLAAVARAGQPVWIESPKALAGIPLAVAGRAISTLVLGFPQPRAFSPDERNFLVAIGQQCAQAMERLRLVERERAAHQAAEEERRRLHRLLAQAPAAMALVSGPAHVFTLANEAFLDLIGRPASETIGRPLRQVAPEIDDQGLVELLDRVVASGEPAFGREFPIRWQEADQRRLGYFDFVFQPLRRADGAVEGVFLHGVEVTDQVRARRRVEDLAGWERERAALLQQLADASLAINAARTVEETLQAIADQARALTGAQLAVSGLTGGSSWPQAVVAFSRSERYAAFDAFTTPPDGSGINAVVCETNETLRLTQAELERHPRWRGFGAHAGAHPPLRGLLAAPFVGRDGVNAGFLQLSDRGDGEDFSAEDEAIVRQLAHLGAVAIENARLFEAQAHARAAAEQAVRERDLFLSAVSHDLRTPLTTIKGQAQLLRRRLTRADWSGAAAAVEGLARIEADASRMNALIEDLLDASRAQAGQAIELQREPVDLAELARGVAAARQAEYAPGEIQVAAPASFVIDADRARLERVVVNLLENAIKYSPERGPIRIELELAGDWATLTVRDEGIGIPASERTRIFEPFQRASNAAARFHGAGIGLAGVRQIVEQHGGAIDVESEEGAGSAFVVRLPVGGGRE